MSWKVACDGEKMLEGPFEGGTILASIASRWLLEPGYMHSFAITSHYYILIEQVSSWVEGDDGLYRPRCQSNLDFLPLVSCLFYIEIL